MPDEMIVKTDTESKIPDSPAIAQNETQSVSLNLSHLIGFSALGLLACFFLPWLNILFVNVSGFGFSKHGGMYALAWAIPLFSLVTFLAGVAKARQREVAAITGMLPFMAFALGMADVGLNIFQILQIGGYGSLIFGLLLIIFAFRIKR